MAHVTLVVTVTNPATGGSHVGAFVGEAIQVSEVADTVPQAAPSPESDTAGEQWATTVLDKRRRIIIEFDVSPEQPGLTWYTTPVGESEPSHE